MNKIYRGIRNDNKNYVTVNNLPLTSDHHEKHKCDFEWGYIGHGPRYLSYAILSNCVNEEIANKYLTKFTHDVVGYFNQDEWQLTDSEIKNKIAEYESAIN